MSVLQSERSQNKDWFHEECSHVLAQMNQAKLQWLQDPGQSNADNE